MISKEQVQHIARLARVELSEKELADQQKEMSAILDYFAILNKVPKPTAKAKTKIRPLQEVLRADKAAEQNKRLAEDLVMQAPGNKDGYVKVKAIFWLI